MKRELNMLVMDRTVCCVCVCVYVCVCVCIYLEFQLPAGSVKHTAGARSDPQPNLLPQDAEPERKPGGQVMVRPEYLRFYQDAWLRQ